MINALDACHYAAAPGGSWSSATSQASSLGPSPEENSLKHNDGEKGVKIKETPTTCTFIHIHTIHPFSVSICLHVL